MIRPQISDGSDFAVKTLVAPSMGSCHQSQFYIRLRTGVAPILTAQDGDVILWVGRGEGKVVIGGRKFPANANTGISIRRGERFQLICSGEPLEIYASTLPPVDKLHILADMTDLFDTRFPDRTEAIDQAARQAMGPRWFQKLIDERHGLENAAQFAGHTPQSRAEMHRHLYEEALIILSGEGYIWNETRRAAVAQGDVIFFPRKHVHSLECTVPEGMDVVGFISPGNNPGINY